ALEAASVEGQPFAVAVVDRSMPEMDGVALTDAVAGNPAIDAALVLMIGVGEEREVGPTGEPGVRACLSKPVHLEDLRAGLRRALGLPAPALAPVEAAPASRAHAPEGGRLLLAEDNVINQKVAVAML